MKLAKRAIKRFRPIYWPLVKIYFRFFSPETRGAKIIITYKNEVLFIKHSYGLKYNFPGGNLGKKEDPEEGIRREVKEELGITLDKITYIDFVIPDIKYEYRKNTIYIFTAVLPSKDINIDNLEIEKVKWLTPDNLPPLGHTAYQVFNIWNNKTFKSQNDTWKKLADTKDKKTAFVDYVESVVIAQEETGEDRKEAGYKICGALQFNELLEVPEFGKILELACNLEIPKAHRSKENQRDEKILWAEIKKVLETYKSKRETT